MPRVVFANPITIPAIVIKTAEVVINPDINSVGYCIICSPPFPVRLTEHLFYFTTFL